MAASGHGPIRRRNWRVIEASHCHGKAPRTNFCAVEKLLVCARTYYMAASKWHGRTFSGPKHSRPRCGARRVDGGRCRAQGLKPSGRCFRHGGLSTGPRSAEGKERQRIAAQKAMLRIWQERRDRKRPMPMTEKRRVERRIALQQRLAIVRAMKQEAQNRQRWQTLPAQWQERRRRESTEKQAAASVRHAQSLRCRRAAKRGNA
jgi:hypothetical protein